MQDTIMGALAVIVACLFVAMLAVAVLVLRPGKRRHRHRRRHSNRPKIDLFTDKAADIAPTADA